ncbi:monofunctional biosynthetic peptidoglycan transglycosylase [Xylophilus rhododendri]|uniref:Biosynthetic peptidoglycan transglycosylase n=2 Tax=Xylophilus rhododendri TaxID=2697032 RepID=A0A857J9S8_9BURK|nr:transglycosylase domain-containing protein [Xylophilus rhododendri]QHI99799.1 monofunctional biosynthetic peptidoglycan transglycosylase [Xylophilus rhododendri]
MRLALRCLGLACLLLLALQLYFAVRIAAMAVFDPGSTAFQRSEATRLARQGRLAGWSQQWVAYRSLPDNLKRAVLASEDAGFVRHHGVEWDAVRGAWQRNTRAESQFARRVEQAEARGLSIDKLPGAKVVGGSTISQQLAKNLFLAGERSLPRKAQELIVTLLLEGLLSKQRILEIYLNSVEWGEGIFGAEAAAQHYFHKPAARLTAYEAARLAVMLPRPKFFERTPQSAYLSGRAGTIAARMGGVALP